jgi:hypothetical protein
MHNVFSWAIFGAEPASTSAENRAGHFSEGGNAQRFQLDDFRAPNRPPLRLKIA